MVPNNMPMHAIIKFATAWRPEAGDVIKGHVITVQKRVSEYGAYPVVILEEDNGDGNEKLWAIHAFHTVLKAELTRIKPTPGSFLEMAYLGKQPSAKRVDANKQPVMTHIYSGTDGTDVELSSWDQILGDNDIDEPGF